MPKIFLDGSDIDEIDNLVAKMGVYDGQTTNPSNFVSSLKKQHEGQLVFSKEELLTLYKKRVQEISQKLPNGSVSIEVYADEQTSVDQMVVQAHEMYTWIPNAHIKLPITHQGLMAARILTDQGIRVNMTLCFSQEQAAAVYAATKGAKRGDVYLSPFIGRINDTGKNGVDLIKHIVSMYKQGDGHVMVLAASIRNGNQLAEAFSVGADITTSYYAAIEEWLIEGKKVTVDVYKQSDLLPIAYKEISLDTNWESYDVSHPMTSDGLKKFANDWNALIN